MTKELEPSFYAVIPATVRYDENLIPRARLLYGEITALANKKGYCWASNKYFADLYKVSTEAIRNWINNLIEHGYIKRQLIYGENKKVIERRIYLSQAINNDSKFKEIKGLGPTQENLGTLPREVVDPTQENLGDNNTLNNTSEYIRESKDSLCSTDVKPSKKDKKKKSVILDDDTKNIIIHEWNKLNLQQLRFINKNTKRHTMLRTRIKDYGLDAVLEGIKKVGESDFLKGQNYKNWVVTFDWFIRPNNFIKVLEGNYEDETGGGQGGLSGRETRQDTGEPKESWGDKLGVVVR